MIDIKFKLEHGRNIIFKNHGIEGTYFSSIYGYKSYIEIYMPAFYETRKTHKAMINQITKTIVHEVFHHILDKSFRRDFSTKQDHFITGKLGLN